MGRNVLHIHDGEELVSLYRQYGPDGEFADVGGNSSNNVQSGLKQWLEYQRQHNSGAIAGYADQRVLQLMSKGTKEERMWVWNLIRRFCKKYPQADHWAVNSTPAKIRIGMREPNNLKGRPAFTLYWYGGEICCAVRNISDHRELLEAQSTRWRVSASTCPTQSDVGS
ncbi:hypothetical protein [Pseudomonas alabamensis]|uniref:hypothetical protein n=1 Tax=Pseudomonas alabamensis TaxID=3064349 RepID=UPI0012D99F06